MPEAAATPPEGLRPPGEQPRDAGRPTRKPLPLWDRIKFLVLLALVWVLLTWAVMANNPLVGISDAIRIEVRAGAWVFVLMGLEALRQIHYLISEHWAAYHRFWTHKVFGRFERISHRRLSDWNRYRIRRLLTWVFWIVVVASVIGKLIHTTPLLALIRAPQLVWHALPFLLQIIVLILVLIIQFAAGASGIGVLPGQRDRHPAGPRQRGPGVARASRTASGLRPG